MNELDRRLRAGPLRVKSLFQPDRAASASRRALERRRRRARSLLIAGASCCLLIAALVTWSWPRSQPSELVSAVRAPVLAPSPRSVRFADGSLAEPRGASSTVHAEHQSASEVRVKLRGAARFDVVPNPARSFEVHTASVVVRVLGTAFSIDPDGERSLVRVERGRVQVSWPDGTAILSAGEAGTFPPRLQATQAASASEPAASLPDALASDAEPSAATLPKHKLAARAERSWQTFARRGEYREAYEQLDLRALSDQPSDLLLAADVARLSGHPEAAVAPLERLHARFPKDKRAPVAAFTLGRVLDELGRAAAAAAAFERASALWPEGPLAEDALWRASDALARAGKTVHARELRACYLERFPNGRHARAIRESAPP